MVIFGKKTSNTVTEQLQMEPAPLEQETKAKVLSGNDFKRNHIINEKLGSAIMEADEEFAKQKQEDAEKEAAIRAAFENTFLRHIIDDFDNTTVTDIKYNGTSLRVQCNVKGRYIADYQPTQGEVRSLLLRIANIQGFEFTDSEPILDTEIGGVRLSANHRITSPTGDTFSIRISKPKLALTDIEDIATLEVGQLLYLLVRAGINIVIAGITGSGKTELQKFLVGAIDDTLNITLMEDTMDSHLKALYPDKDINSWRTLPQENRKKKIFYRDLIKASLRNNPEWAIISETRGDDAASVLEVALTGHSIMTTIHAKNALSIPMRMIDMIVENSNQNTEIVGNNIVEYLPIGIHMKTEITPTGIRRFISEIVEYTGYSNGRVSGNVLYKVTKNYNAATGTYDMSYRIGKLSQKLVEELTDAEVIHLLPTQFAPSVEADQS